MTEMVEAFWNSPSIVAWSTGNEYQSWTPEGDEWTLFQRKKYLELDTTRLITFMSLGSAGNAQNLLPPHDSYRLAILSASISIQDWNSLKNHCKTFI